MEIIEILIQARDLATSKIARVRQELAALGKSDSTVAPLAARLEKLVDIDPTNLSRIGAEAESVAGDFGALDKRVHDVSASLRAMGQLEIPHALSSSPSLSAFEGVGGEQQPLRGVTQQNRFMPAVERQIVSEHDIDLVRQHADALEADNQQMVLFGRDTERIAASFGEFTDAIERVNLRLADMKERLAAAREAQARLGENTPFARAQQAAKTQLEDIDRRRAQIQQEAARRELEIQDQIAAKRQLIADADQAIGQRRIDIQNQIAAKEREIDRVSTEIADLRLAKEQEIIRQKEHEVDLQRAIQTEERRLTAELNKRQRDLDETNREMDRRRQALERELARAESIKARTQNAQKLRDRETEIKNLNTDLETLRRRSAISRTQNRQQELVGETRTAIRNLPKGADQMDLDVTQRRIRALEEDLKGIEKRSQLATERGTLLADIEKLKRQLGSKALTLDVGINRDKLLKEIDALGKDLESRTKGTDEFGKALRGLDIETEKVGKNLDQAARTDPFESMVRGTENEIKKLRELEGQLSRLRSAGVSREELDQLAHQIPVLRQATEAYRLNLARVHEDTKALDQDARRTGSSLNKILDPHVQRQWARAADRLDAVRGKLTEVRAELAHFDRLQGTMSLHEFAAAFPPAAMQANRLRNEERLLRNESNALTQSMIRLERTKPAGLFGNFARAFRESGNDAKVFLEDADELAKKVLPNLSAGMRQGSHGSDQFGGSVGRLANRLDELSGIDETLILGLRRFFSFGLAIGALLPLIGGALGEILAAAVALVGGVTALAGAFGTLVGVLGTLPSLLATVGGSMLAIQTIFKPVATNLLGRVQEVIQAQTTRRRALGRADARAEQKGLADPEVAKAKAVADARREAAQSEKDAEEELSRTRRDAAEREADQQRSLIDLRHDGLQEIHDQEIDLQNTIRDNREQELDLTKDILRTRRDLNRQLKEAEDRARDARRLARLEEEDLRMTLLDAQAQLRTLIETGANPDAISSQRFLVRGLQTQMKEFPSTDVAVKAREATQNVKDVRIKNAETLQDMEKRLTRMKRDDRQQENTAETRLFRTKRDFIQRIARAEQQLFRTRRDDLERITEAEVRLQRLRRDNLDKIKAAQKGTATGSGATILTPAETLRTALAGLSPLEKKIVLAMLHIRTEWKKLTEATKVRGEQLFQNALKWVQDHLPAITGIANDYGNALLDIAENMTKIATRTDNLARIFRIFDTGRVVLKNFGKALTNLITPLLEVGDAARPLTEKLSGDIARLTKALAARVEEAKQVPPEKSPRTQIPQLARGGRGVQGPGGSGGQKSELQRFFDSTDRVVHLLAKSTANILDTLLHILVIAEPFGEQILGKFLKWTEKVDKWSKSQKGKNAIKEFFKDATPAFLDLISTAGKVITALFNIGRALIRPGKHGEKSQLAILLEQIRSGLPGFEKAMIRMTTQFMPKFIKLLGRVIEVLTALSAPGGPLDIMLFLIDKAFIAFNTLFKTLPEKIPLIGRDLRPILGTLVLMSALSPGLFKLLKIFIDLGRFSAGATKTMFALGKVLSVTKKASGDSFFQRLGKALSVTPSGAKFSKAISGAWDTLRLRALYAGDAVRRASTKIQSGLNRAANVAQRAWKKILNEDGSIGSGASESRITRLFRGLRARISTALGAAATAARSGATRVRTALQRALDLGTAGARVATARLQQIGKAAGSAIANGLSASRSVLAAAGSKLVGAMRVVQAGMIASMNVIRAAMVAFRATMIGAFLTNPIVIGILAIIAIIILLDRKFHFIRPTIEFFKKTIAAVPDFIKKHWKLLVAILLGPFGLVIAAAIKFRHQIVNGFLFIVNWVKRNWKTIATILVAIFVPGGLILVAFFKFKKQIFDGLSAIWKFFVDIGKKVATGFLDGFKTLLDFFGHIGRWFYDHLIKPILNFFGISSPSTRMFNIGKQLVAGIVNAFAALPGLVLKLFEKLPTVIWNALSGLPNLIGDLIKKIPGLKKILGLGGKIVGGIRGAAGHLGLAAGGRVKGKPVGFAAGGRVRGTGYHDSIPKTLVPGDWVVTQRQQHALARISGKSSREIEELIFTSATNKELDSHNSVETILAPGEWVVKQRQQGALARITGKTPREIEELIFQGAGGKKMNFQSGGIIPGKRGLTVDNAVIRFETLMTALRARYFPWWNGTHPRITVDDRGSAPFVDRAANQGKRDISLPSEYLGRFIAGNPFAVHDATLAVANEYQGDNLDVMTTHGTAEGFATLVRNYVSQILRVPAYPSSENVTKTYPVQFLLHDQFMRSSGQDVLQDPVIEGLRSRDFRTRDLAVKKLAKKVWDETRTFYPSDEMPPVRFTHHGAIGGSTSGLTDVVPAVGKRNTLLTASGEAEAVAHTTWGIEVLLHEWAHAFQNRETLKDDSTAEGGATAFSHRIMALKKKIGGVVLGATSVATSYREWAAQMLRERGLDWIMHGQFARNFEGQRESNAGAVAGRGARPLFTAEGPSFYQQAYKFFRPFAQKGPYRTTLNRHEERAFRTWVKNNHVDTFNGFNVDARIADYDMRGFWKATNGAPLPENKSRHFPDTWKTPYDTSFSRESRYATPNNPFIWRGNKLVDRRNGRLIFQAMAEGGVIPGMPTFPSRDSVPILAAPGEWVVNEKQKHKLTMLTGLTTERLRTELFSTTDRRPRMEYALGGEVRPLATSTQSQKTVTVHQKVDVHTTSPRVDIDYVARALENRMSTL